MLIQIAIRYCGIKNKELRRLMIENESDVSELQEKIKTIFGLPVEEQVLRFKAHDFEIRVIPGFTLDFYEIGNNALVELYRLNCVAESGAAETTDGYSSHSAEEEDDYAENVRLLNKLMFAKGLQGLQMEEIGEEEMEEDEFEKTLQALKKRFLEITSMKQRKDFESFYTQFMTLDRVSQKQVLSSPDKVGWTGIHYAVRDNEEWAIQPLLDNFAEDILSVQSDDGWTPLLLAVQNKNWEMLEELLKYATKANLEFITSKGSVIHQIFKNADFRIVHYLIVNKEIDPSFKDKLDVPAISLLKPEAQSHVKVLLKLRDVPPKPVNLHFEVQKKSLFFSWASRSLYINSEGRSLERYKARNDFPFQPREVIPLHAIENLTGRGRFASKDQNDKNDYVFDQRTGEVVQKSVFEKHENFIQFSFNGENHSYRIHSETHAKLALKTLNQAVQWARFYELFIRKLNGAELESGMAVWKAVAVDFSTYDLMDPIQFTNLLKLDMRDTEHHKTETTAKVFQGLRQFNILKLIGRGAFGKVYKVFHKDSQKVFAMKVLNKKTLLRDNQIKYSMIEKEILQANPKDSFLLSLHFAFQTVENLFMVIDFCPNEDLSVLLNKQDRNLLPEDTARFYIAELFLAINELHKRNYIYRDLKPENILLDEQGHIKLADFGLAAKNIRNATDFAKSFCGSPMYIAPEILKNKTAFKSTDYYTMGVVIFEMLTGEPPFYNENFEKLYSLIKKGDFKFPPTVNLSDEAKDLISRLICMPKKRLGAVSGFEEVKRHPWFATIDWAKLADKKVDPPIKFPPIVHNFNRPIKLKDTEYSDEGPRQNFIPNFEFIGPDYQNK